MRGWRSYFIVAIITLGVTMLAWLTLESYDHSRIHQRIQDDAQSVESNLRASLIRLMYTAEITGELLQQPSISVVDDPGQAINDILADFYKSVEAVILVDDELKIIQTYGSVNAHLAQQTELLVSPEDRLHIQQSQLQPLFVDGKNLANDAHHFALIVPFKDGSTTYFMVLLVDLQELFGATIRHHIQEGNQVSVVRDNQPIFSFAANDDLRNLWGKEFTIRIADSRFLFTLWPSHERFEQLHIVRPIYLPLAALFLLGLGFLAAYAINKRELNIKRLNNQLAELQLHLQTKNELQARLEFLSEHDALTELPNRNALIRYLIQHLAEQQAELGNTLVLQLNLDHFKDINNALGHKIGDELLRRVAHRLERLSLPGSYLARLGGDEFLLVKADVNSNDKAHEIATLVNQQIEPQFFINNHEIYSSFSIGMAFANDANYDAETLLRHADIALNKAKQIGYRGVCIYTQDQQSELSQRLYILEQLHEAIESQKLEVHYQPIFDLRSNQIVSLEGLLRWRQHDGDLAFPEYFLPLVEDTGLIVRLTETILRKIFNQFKTWRDGEYHDLKIGINLSGKQLALPELPELLKENLRRTNIPAQLVYIEIREELYCSHAQFDDGILVTLKKLGFRLTVDGLGLNYASIAAMEKCVPHQLKIGQPLIEKLPYDVIQSLITDTMIKFSRHKAIEISAVGVENQQQVDFLLQRDCVSAQGYFLSRPVPAEQVQSILDAQIQQRG